MHISDLDKPLPVPPQIVITVEDGLITEIVVDRMMIVTVVDHDVKRQGGKVGEIVHHRAPNRILPPGDIGAMIRNTVHELIDKGY